MKKVALFGSTGSIGKTTLNVIAHHAEAFSCHILTAHSNIDLLEKQIAQFKPKQVVVVDAKKGEELKRRVSSVKVLVGREALEEAAASEEVDIVVMALTGLAALFPTLAAVKKGKRIALASKEVLVSGGHFFMELVKKHRAELIPVDSEHSALFQAMKGEKREHILKLILTASGGPFRNHSLEELKRVGVKEALSHPTWQMGPKVTVDSSTLMNKALEVIEAHILFGIDQIEVLVHPQSAVHGFVEMLDGTQIAVITEPNMAFPIQYALTYPERRRSTLPSFDFLKNNRLEFYPPDLIKFPTLSFAKEAMRVGKSVPCFLNAADEVLVERFLKEEISWLGIIERLDALLGRHLPQKINSLEDILEVDLKARKEAETI